MSAFWPTVIISATLLAQASAIEWASVTLSGEFEGVEEAKALGASSYSFSKQSVVDKDGDLVLSLDYSSSYSTKLLLKGGYIQPLQSIVQPIQDQRHRGFRGMTDGFKVGKYYYVNSGPIHAVIQITDLYTGPRTRIGEASRGSIERGQASVSFKYIMNRDGLDQLNRVLLGGGNTYTIRPGDTLNAIADTYGISVDQLKAANKIGFLKVIRVVVPHSTF